MAVALALAAAPATAPAIGAEAAATGSTRRPSEPQVAAFDASVELVTLSVSVLDDHGAPLADLAPEDFAVYEDGERRPTALLLTPAQTPLDVALLVDLSSSMRTERWRDRARDFLDALGARDCAFLLGFSTVPGGSAWGRPDDEILHRALRDADAAGGTALFDALLIGLREIERSGSGGTLRGAARGALNPASSGSELIGVRANNPCPTPLPPGHDDDPELVRRKAVVVVSDGSDSTSSGGAEVVLSAAELAGVPIFPIRLDGERGGAGVGSASPRAGGGRRRAALEEGGNVLEQLAAATGGKSVRAGEAGYAEILAWLRGSYVVGYYTTASRDAGAGRDFIRHEVRVEVDRPGARLIYQPAYFLPSADRGAARQQVDEAGELIAGGDLDLALLLLDRAIRADPRYAPAHFQRAVALADAGRLSDAQRDALRAAWLSPGVASMHHLAMEISLDLGDPAQAWEQAIRATQAGADLRPYRERLEAAGPPPTDLDARLVAPRILVARPYTPLTDLLMDTALAKVLQTVRQQLAAAPLLGVVVDPARADYVMTIRGERLGGDRPRRLDGELEVADLAGKRVYDTQLLLEDVDSPSRVAASLERFIRDLEVKLNRGGDR